MTSLFYVATRWWRGRNLVHKYFTPNVIVPNLRRIRLTLEYDGTPFYGWQSQKSPEVPTIQKELEKAFFALTGAPPEDMAAAGRTDKGVHATGMICHIDTFHTTEIKKIKTGLNRYLPDGIAVLMAEETDQYFHARYCCKERHYQYKILNRMARSPLWHNRAALVRHPLDVAAMAEGAKVLEGSHDFSAFRSSECQGKTPVTTLNKLTISEENGLITFDIHGVTFLHNMVRILVGTLVDVGHGKIDAQAVATILAHKDRKKAGKTMPPHGLYFTKALF